MPLVSVITGMHDAGPFIGRTIASVLRQDFADFELIVADDGSTDAGPDLVRAVRDARVRLLPLGKVGRSAALNIALGEARGELAAILDADDLCEPDRLMRQAAAFAADPALTVAGSTCRFIDAEDRPRDVFRVPLGHACILWQSLFHNTFVHSASMFRLSAARGLAYETALEPSEDYAFLTALAWSGKAANDERPLVRYRVHERQLSQTRQRVQQDNAARIHRRNLARLGWAGEPPAHARDWLWGLPVTPQPEHAELLDFYLTLLGRLETRPHVQPGDLTILRRELERARAGP